MRTVVLAWLVSVSCVASGAPDVATRVGVCLDPSKIADAKAAGFDYVEVGASKVAALGEDDFARLVRHVERLGVRVPAANGFIPGTIKLVGPDVEAQKQDE